MKALVGAFNQEKALVGAFSVIVQPVVELMDRFAALVLIQAGPGTADTIHRLIFNFNKHLAAWCRDTKTKH